MVKLKNIRLASYEGKKRVTEAIIKQGSGKDLTSRIWKRPYIKDLEKTLHQGSGKDLTSRIWKRPYIKDLEKTLHQGSNGQYLYKKLVLWKRSLEKLKYWKTA